MKTPTRYLVLALALLTLTACGGADEHDHDHDHDHAHPHTEPGAKPTAGEKPHHDHGHGDETQHPFGPTTVGSIEVRGVIFGKVTPGRHVPIDIYLSGGTADQIRVWIGDAQATGSMRVRATAMGDRHHADVHAPATLSTDVKLWIELETAGTRVPHGFALPIEQTKP